MANNNIENTNIHCDYYKKYNIINYREIDNLMYITEKRSNVEYRATNDNNGDTIVTDDNIVKFGNLGILYKDYLEVYINFDKDNFVNPENKKNYFELYNFRIDNVDIEIDTPSLLFDISMSEMYDKYYRDANTGADDNEIWTISFKGISKINCEEYINKAIFVLREYSNSINLYWEPVCERYNSYVSSYLDFVHQFANVNVNKFSNINFNKIDSKLIALYNYGCKSNDQFYSFLLFYKIIENKFAKIKMATESERLKEYIKNMGDKFKQHIKQAINFDLISNTDLCNTDAFSDSLYKYRCSLVHSKDNFEVPELLDNDKLIKWCFIIKDLSYLIILEDMKK